MNNSNNQTEFSELRNVFEEKIEIKVQKVSLLKNMDFWISQYPLELSIDQTDHIMDLVNKQFPTGSFYKG